MQVTDQERVLAKEVADLAMVKGWNAAINSKAKELRVSSVKIASILDAVAKYNDKADPSGRIDELEDWTIQKRDRSDRASNFATRAS